MLHISHLTLGNVWLAMRTEALTYQMIIIFGCYHISKVQHAYKKGPTSYLDGPKNYVHLQIYLTMASF